MYFGAFFGSFSSKKCFSKSPQSVLNCPPIFWGSVLWIWAPKVVLEHSFILFCGIKLNTYFTLESSCLFLCNVSTSCPYPVLGLLAVLLNEPETSLFYSNKIVNGLSSWVFVVFGWWIIIRTATKSLVKHLYWHFTGKNCPKERFLGASRHL